MEGENMEGETRLIHTADTHIGYRQYHSDVRRQDFLKAFATVVDDAIVMKVDAVIHAGDLFDSRNPALEDILRTAEILARLKQAGIPFLGIVGNHESKQHIQWLDLFGSMGLAIRLGSTPLLINNIALYGIDNVPKPKIAGFDYSVFSPPPEEADYSFLVMHQLMTPFPFGEWDSEELITSMPFRVDAVLLGDNHKYEKTKVGETWLTYPGSTERNSAAEKETRGYNLITVNEKGSEIGRRNIPTRDFLSISVTLKKGSEPYRDILNTAKENNLRDCVVFLEIGGDADIEISYSQIEEFLLKEGALVCRIIDNRISGVGEEEPAEIVFSDPDLAVQKEIRRMGLSEGGRLVDEIVRDFSISRSNVDGATQNAFAGLLEEMDFTQVPENTVKKKDTVPPEKKEAESLPGEKEKPQQPEEKTMPAEEKKAHEPRQYNLGDYL
jgi:DNA repair exonuclease SbcCD nuclease subunit